MFDKSSVMVIKAEKPSIEICRLQLASKSQKAICKVFSDAASIMRNGKTKIPFDGSYRPLEDEYLSIEDFSLDDRIKDAIRNPLGVRLYTFEKTGFPEIKAIFVGMREIENKSEKFTVALQRFRKEQYITPAGWVHLYFDNNTFIEEKRYGIGISDTVDCLFDKSDLCFTSYYFARQVLNLSDYYRSAMDSEVLSFSRNKKLTIGDTAAFEALADTWIRRKIALINDSGVLSQYSATRIKSLANAAGINIAVENKRLVIPTEKEALKVVLGFLDEEAYRGPFSQVTFLANSKRKVSK